MIVVIPSGSWITCYRTGSWKEEINLHKKIIKWTDEAIVLCLGYDDFDQWFRLLSVALA